MGMKVALVHDYLREYGGAERVVESLHEMWPEAPLYTAFVDWGSLGSQGKRFKGWDIRTSWVQQVPIIAHFISPLRFLAPWIWNSINLSGYDVVISSSGWFMCRGVALESGGTEEKEGQEGRKKKRALHICYIHHPPRNLYGYATGSDLQKYWPVRLYATIVNFFLRHYDWETAQKVDYFIANSLETARRVKKFYRRESRVIYPPISNIHPPAGGPISNKKRDYYLSVGRLTWAKRVDLAILACNKLKLPLKIVGKGNEEEYLRSIAARPPSAGAEGAAGWSPTIEFVGGVDDSELARLYAGAKALIFCALDEDFGMVPVEAMAAGTPVIGLAQGGVLETVVEGVTGVLFHEPTVESLVGAIRKFQGGPTSPRLRGGQWGNNCKKQAGRVSKERV